MTISTCCIDGSGSAQHIKWVHRGGSCLIALLLLANGCDRPAIPRVTPYSHNSPFAAPIPSTRPSSQNSADKTIEEIVRLWGNAYAEPELKELLAKEEYDPRVCQDDVVRLASLTFPSDKDVAMSWLACIRSHLPAMDEHSREQTILAIRKFQNAPLSDNTQCRIQIAAIEEAVNLAPGIKALEIQKVLLGAPGPRQLAAADMLRWQLSGGQPKESDQAHTVLNNVVRRNANSWSRKSSGIDLQAWSIVLRSAMCNKRWLMDVDISDSESITTRARLCAIAAHCDSNSQGQIRGRMALMTVPSEIIARGLAIEIMNCEDAGIAKHLVDGALSVVYHLRASPDAIMESEVKRELEKTHDILLSLKVSNGRARQSATRLLDWLEQK